MPLYYTAGQWYAFEYMLLCGVVMGAVCELFRAARRLTEAGKLLTALMDAVMCMVLALIMAAMTLRANGGELRAFMLAGCAAGMAIFKTGPAVLLRHAALGLQKIVKQMGKSFANVSFFRHILK